MNEPRRFMESDGTSDAVRELLGAGRRTSALPADVKGRGARRVAVMAAVPVGIGALVWNSGTLFAAAMGAGIGLSIAVVGSEVSKRPVPPELPQQQAKGARKPAIPLPRRPAAEQTAPAEAVAEAPAPMRPSERARTDTLQEEARLLERASALVASDPAAALGLTQEHATRYPRGKLSVERSLIEIDALSRAGRTVEARRRIETLRATLKDGLYARRLEKLSERLSAGGGRK